ncbi:hypothetical protein LBO01_23960 [Companilactobacillus paralimentarius]|nr:hypothetical protein LBO01_23960 [Companilactobacillus paralimentarius]
MPSFHFDIFYKNKRILHEEVSLHIELPTNMATLDEKEFLNKDIKQNNPSKNLLPKTE